MLEKKTLNIYFKGGAVQRTSGSLQLARACADESSFPKEVLSSISRCADGGVDRDKVDVEDEVLSEENSLLADCVLTSG